MCGGHCIILSGDAQDGNWLSWLENKAPEDILSRVPCLKVAHHGSHNATPRYALARMTGGSAAMEKLDKLTKSRVVHSDSFSVPSSSKAPKGPVISQLSTGFIKGDFWYDYIINL